MTIATAGDAINGGSCSLTAGCSVTLTVSWVQGARSGSASTADVTRSQVFYYQFGL